MTEISNLGSLGAVEGSYYLVGVEAMAISGQPGGLATIDQIVARGMLDIGAGESIAGTDTVFAEVGGELQRIPVSALPTGSSYTAGTNISIAEGEISLNPIGLPRFLYSYVPGTLTNSQELYAINLGEDVTAPSGLVGSYASADVTATANATFALSFGGTAIAALVFPAGSATGTFSGSGGAGSAGALAKWAAPATADATLAGVRITTKLAVAA